jgi:glycosyltransferase involved in cell wall biosynthesis
MNREPPRSILFAVPFPTGEAPSQRFRFEQYFRLLDERGVRYHCAPFWNEKTWRILYEPGHHLKKALGLFAGFVRRLGLLSKLAGYDVVYIHREMAPVGPPVFEWLIARVFNKPVVYDFDDAVWIRNVSRANRFADRFKNYGKVAKICAWAARVSAGNRFLADYARRFNGDVVVVPTVVDTETYHDRTREISDGVPVVGWTGTHSTADYLRPTASVFDDLSRETTFELAVIADRIPPDLTLCNLRFRRWSKRTEIEDLLRFDIGIMPMPDTDWARGKCGFKVIQYMALGIPPVASPVGVNADIVEDGVDGFLCADETQWKRALETLLRDPELRRRTGAAAREKVVREYSVAANSDRFLASIEGAAQ